MKNCDNCRFRLGTLCRRYPPQHTVSEKEVHEYLDDGHKVRDETWEHVFAFPTVEKSDWCGEWEAREEKDE